jgi:uncharacterized delta-60 repeat protein
VLVGAVLLLAGCVSPESVDPHCPAVVCPTFTYSGPPGSLDTTFNGTGMVPQQANLRGGPNEYAYAVAEDSLSRITTVGYSFNGVGCCTNFMAIWRFTDTGQIDTTFNGTGSTTSTDTEGGSQTFAVGLDVSNPSYVWVGGGANDAAENPEVAIWRYLTDGTPDASFNGTGLAYEINPLNGSGLVQVQSFTLDGSGRPVITGYASQSAPNFFMTFRFTTAGVLETSYNAAGYTDEQGTGGAAGDVGTSGAIDSAGNVVATGSAYDGTNTHMVVYRYLAGTGLLDPAFNTTGYYVEATPVALSQDIGGAVAVDSQGRIVVAGYASDNPVTTKQMAIWRLTPSGALDTTFAGTGFVTMSGTAGGSVDQASMNGLLIDSEDRILVTGSSQNASAVAFMVLWRFTDTGALDTTFNGTGYRVFDGATAGLGSTGIGSSFDSHGRILTAGTSTTASGTAMNLWRINP